MASDYPKLEPEAVAPVSSEWLAPDHRLLEPKPEIDRDVPRGVATAVHPHAAFMAEFPFYNRQGADVTWR